MDKRQCWPTVVEVDRKAHISIAITSRRWGERIFPPFSSLHLLPLIGTL